MKIGERYYYTEHVPGPRFAPYIEIMAIAKNYVMARHKGCMPFVRSVKAMQAMIDNQLMEIQKKGKTNGTNKDDSRRTQKSS